MTTSPRTTDAPPAGGPDYGDLDQDGRGYGRGTPWGVITGVVALVAVGGFVLAFFPRGESASAPSLPPTSVSTTQGDTNATSPTTAPPTTTSSTPAVELEVNGWELSNSESELPTYIESPRLFEAGSLEGDVEIGFLNSEIASMRALANPGVEEEPELSFWKTGFTLRAARDVRAVLAEDGQVILPGALTRIEIESIAIRSDSEADVEYCTLIHDYNVVVDDPEDRIESLVTRHAINRMTLGPDGQWQNSELVTEIQVVDGVGPCLDVELSTE